jgi:uncharacterized coiled-coil protein SlyX
MPTPEELSARVQSLEMLAMHLQHDVEQMNEVILAQQAEIRGLRTLLERFQGQLENALRDPEVRDIEEERPPHY